MSEIRKQSNDFQKFDEKYLEGIKEVISTAAKKCLFECTYEIPVDLIEAAPKYKYYLEHGPLDGAKISCFNDIKFYYRISWKEDNITKENERAALKYCIQFFASSIDCFDDLTEFNKTVKILKRILKNF